MGKSRKLRRYYLTIKRFCTNWKKLSAVLVSVIITLALTPFILHILIEHNYKDRKFETIEDIESRKVAIVFGAGVWGDSPSPVLRDRVLTAVELYKAGKVRKIIMSGDNRFANYDEPTAMIKMALEEGVPEVALQPDYAGRRTYDTCMRANKIFKVDEAILVTQDFHMDRALYTCNALGVDSIGLLADKTDYPNESKYSLRDKFALVKAIWEINISSPNDVVLGDTIQL